MDGLQFNALIEDDHLSAAFLDAQNKSQDPTAIFDMALKAECDSGPGHVCYFGPIATEFFRDALGLDCMITSTDELSMTGRLSKPLAVVHHGQHWVPMWSKSVFGLSKAGLLCLSIAMTCMWKDMDRWLGKFMPMWTAPAWLQGIVQSTAFSFCLTYKGSPGNPLKGKGLVNGPWQNRQFGHCSSPPE